MRCDEGISETVSCSRLVELLNTMREPLSSERRDHSPGNVMLKAFSEMAVSLGLGLEHPKKLRRPISRKMKRVIFTMDVRSRLTTPSSATAESGAAPAWWVERRRRKQVP